MPEAPTLVRERRASPRSRTPIRVLINDPGDALDDPYPGLVLDRSKGGVRLAVGQMEIEEGTVLGLVPAEAGYPCEVRVVHRSRRNNNFELGCQFVQANGWDVLRQ
ncbi:MAG: PilZ domain-containing protein [Gemmataceae bacterium]